jgi:O-antigen/teichoic acid export membrane protein
MRSMRSTPRGTYRIYTSALALMISAAGSGILGLIYWDVAAHLASPQSVGRAAGEIAAITLLSTLAQLSFGPVFERFLPRAGDKAASIVRTGYLTSMVAAIVIGVGYVALGFTHRIFSSSLNWDLLFIATIVFYTVFALQDAVLISLRVARWVAVENIVFGIAKLALLVPLATYSLGQGVVVSWTIPLFATILSVNVYIFASRLPSHVANAQIVEPLPTLRRMLSLSIPQYAGTVLSIFSTSVISLIVIARLGAVNNAHYFLVAQVAVAPTLFIWSISRLLIVEISHEPNKQLRYIRQSTIAMGAVALVGMVVGVFFAHRILEFFGSTYAAQGSTLLLLLMLSLPGTVVVATFAALAWIDGRVWLLAVREGSSMLVYLSIVLVLIDHHGINSVGYAALATSVVELAIFLPLTIKRIRSVVTTGSAMPAHSRDEGLD